MLAKVFLMPYIFLCRQDGPAGLPAQKWAQQKEDVMSDLKNTTAIKSALRDCAKAVKAHDGRMAQLVVPLVQADVTETDLKPKGLFYEDLVDGVAIAYLTEKEYGVWSDTSLSISVKGVKTERGKLQERVSSNVQKVRNNILKACGAEDAAKGAAKVARGPGWKADPLTAMCERVQKDLNTLVSAGTGTAKSAFWKNFVGDTNEARRALANALKALEALK